MRYSQPYGTPEPPLGTYPRYINGNPVTGTEGSIPPATAFDEAQVEIVNVIANAKAGRTTAYDPTLSDPDHTKLYQLWDSIMSLIARKFITTPIVKTVHGAGADFPDLHAALDWLSVYTITWTGSVTFMIAPGKWVYTRSVEINHANSNRIFFQGGALLGAAPVPGNMSTTGWSPTARANDGSQHIIYLRSIFATELSFTGGKSGFQVYSQQATFRYLLITGSQSVDTSDPSVRGGCGLVMYADVWVDCIAVWGFGLDGIFVSDACLRMRSSLSITVSFCKSHGAQVLAGSWIAEHNSHCIFKSCGDSGFRLAGGHGYFAKCTAYGNGGDSASSPQPGMDVFDGGDLMCENYFDCEYNAHSGLAASFGALSSRYSTSWFSNNGLYGIYLVDGSNVFVYGGSLGANGAGYSVVASGGSNAVMTGSSLAQQSSPPPNTLGNGNSYITL